MEALLAELVAAPTLLGAEAAGQAVMRRAFAELGLEPFDVPLDAGRARAAHPARRAVQLGRRRQGQRGRRLAAAGAADGRSLILNGHIDVVSPEPASLWAATRSAPRRDGEWMYGRGAGDMKAGLAAIVGAVRGLQRLGLAPRGRVQLQSVVEEECTGNGALACVLAGHRRTPRSSPSRPAARSGTPRSACCGSRCASLGAPAHAGDAPDGANAIEGSYAVIQALRGLEAELNAVKPPLFAAYPHPINLNVGMIRGGDWPSTVAGECITHFRLATLSRRAGGRPQGPRGGDRRGGRRATARSRCSTTASSARATS